MIGIYADDESRLPMSYGGLTINDDAYPVGSAVVAHRYDSVTEPHAQQDGMEGYGPRRLVTTIRIDGTVEGESIAELHDRIEAINAAFDPVLSAIADIDRFGYREFTFSVPTEDIINYADGLIPMQYYARSLALPVPRVSKFEGLVARFTLELQAVDPRRYLQTESTHELTNGTSELDNSLATYPSFPTVAITMTGAGENDFRIEFDEENNNLQFDLTSLAADDELVVDYERKRITVNGVDRMDLLSSGTWGRVLPGTQNFTISGATGQALPRVLTWRRAFV